MGGKGPEQTEGRKRHFRNAPMDRGFGDVLFCYIEWWYAQWRIFSKTKNG